MMGALLFHYFEMCDLPLFLFFDFNFPFRRKTLIDSCSSLKKFFFSFFWNLKFSLKNDTLCSWSSLKIYFFFLQSWTFLETDAIYLWKSLKGSLFFLFFFKFIFYFIYFLLKKATKKKKNLESWLSQLSNSWVKKGGGIFSPLFLSSSFSFFTLSSSSIVTIHKFLPLTFYSSSHPFFLRKSFP